MSGVELGAIGHSAHVAADEAEPRVFAIRSAGGTEHGGREIHADHRVAAPGKLAGVPPEAAGHVEHTRAGPEREHPGHEVDLRPRAPLHGGPVRRQVGGVEEAPEPLARRRHRPTPAPGTRARACSPASGASSGGK